MDKQLTRRAFLIGGAAAGVAVASGAVLLDEVDSDMGDVELPPADRGLPPAQHAWNAVLDTDAFGTPQLPTHARLLLFDLADRPNAAAARYLEAMLRRLERRYAWGPQGVVFTIGWGPRYFHRLGVSPPVPEPTSLSSFETPTLDTFDAVVHLASHDAARLDDVTAALTRGARLPGAAERVDLRPVLRWRETRTGFKGPGVPAAHQHVRGIPDTAPVPGEAPLFMGFRSGFRKNQATEDDVTISEGPLAGGTTMHVSQLRLTLDSWYGLLDRQQRVDRMFAPQLPAPRVDQLADEAPAFADRAAQAAASNGVCGHLQLAARARRDNRPVILRRDVDTVDGGEAGLHFVALQRSIADFVDTRRAMNGEELVGKHPAVKPRVNNGIKEFFLTRRRANFVVPPRPQRAYPLLPDRDLADT